MEDQKVDEYGNPVSLACFKNEHDLCKFNNCHCYCHQAEYFWHESYKDNQ